MVSLMRVCLAGLAFFFSLHARADGIDDLVKAEMQKRQIPGLSLAVIKDGEVVKAQGYGFANLEHQVAATAHTVYEIGSISKQFTAVTIMMLVEEGKVGLNDTISAYLNGLPSAWNHVTIKHLLTHTSGIPDFEEVIGYGSYRNVFTDEALIKTVSALPMDFSPGEKWSYSNTGYVLLGMLLEKVTGKPYPEVIQERIFQPLGMLESRDSDPVVIIPHRAAGYALERKSLENRDAMQPSACKGAGTLVSTVLDMAKWDAALYAEKLVKSSSWEQIWMPVKLNDGTTFPYGFGWLLMPWQGHKLLMHSGGTAGFTTQFSRFTDDHITVVVLTNLYALNRLGKLANTIAGFFVPALSPPVYAAVPDSEPSFTGVVRRLYETRLEADAKWDSTLFTPEFWSALKPGLSGNLEYFRDLGPVISVVLVERRSEGENRLCRYRISYKAVSRLVLVTRNKDGRISAFQAEEE